MVLRGLDVRVIRPNPADWFVASICAASRHTQGGEWRGVRAPWRVVPGTDGEVSAVYLGSEPVMQVRVAAWTDDAAYLSLPRRAVPGDMLQFKTPHGHASGTVMLRWFTGDGTEWLWPSAW